MKILMATSELQPYAKTGGLAEAVRYLAQNLAVRGHDVRILLPWYGFIDAEAESASRVKLENGSDDFTLDFHEIQEQENLRIVLVRNDNLFGNRQGIYGEEGLDYFDNSQRYAVFCDSVFHYIESSAWPPDLLIP